METKKVYIAPELTVVTVKSERGYSASNNPLAALQMVVDAIGLNSGNMESWTFDQEDQTFNDNTIEWS